VLMTNDHDTWRHIRAAIYETDDAAENGEPIAANLEQALAEIIGLSRSLSIAAEEMLRAVSETNAAVPAEIGMTFSAAPTVLEAARNALRTLLESLQSS
jgi:hypothetical protein